MSFSSETKNELSRTYPTKNCCKLAEIAGFLRTAGSIGLAGGGKFNIALKTENPAVARHYKKLLKDYFDVDSRLDVEEGAAINKGYFYKLVIGPEMRSDQILRETGILMVRQGNNFISDGIYQGIIRSKCCKKAYLKGMFLGAGTMANPDKSYQMEWPLSSRTLAEDLLKLINSFVDMDAKMVKRKSQYVVYVKSYGYIRDLMTMMGAHTMVLELENIKIKKELRGEAVRLTNCDTANMDRVIGASGKQIEAIKFLDGAVGLNKLPEKLREIAILRLEHPEASLLQLGEMLTPPLKKSGVNNRMKKLMNMYERGQK